MGEREPLCTVGGNINWCSFYRKLYEGSPPPKKKMKKELPYNPAIPLLDIYPNNLKTLTHKDICTPMFTEALFIIANT